MRCEIYFQQRREADQLHYTSTTTFQDHQPGSASIRLSTQAERMRNAKRLRASQEVGSQPSQDVEVRFQPSQDEEIRSQPSQGKEVGSQPSQDREIMSQASQDIEVRSQPSQDEELRSQQVELESARDQGTTPPPEQNISLVSEAVADSRIEVTGDHEYDDDEEEEEMDPQDVFDDWMLGLEISA